ncbi:YybS family protein [Chryseomicrobium palamuruense]|uniref:YybS family protein n=1 Tax=Chryseomicrobium palamuruense TaxID=682973 RepID=A0ABV8UQW7_9BACL
MQQETSPVWKHGLTAWLVFVGLTIFSVYLPALALVGLLLSVIPIAWFRAKHSRNSTFLLVVFSLIAAVLLGSYPGLFVAMVTVPIGFIIGDGLARRQSKVYLFISTAIVLMLTSVMQLALTQFLFSINLIEEGIDQLRASYIQVGEMMESVGQLPNDFDEIVRTSLQTFSLVLPGYFIAMMFVAALVYISVALPILRKLKVPVPRFAAFRHFQLPRAVIWYYLIVSLLSLFAVFEAGSFGEMILVNAVFIFRALLFLQGISLVHFYFHHQSWPKWGAIATTIVLIPFYSIVVIIGVIDLGFRLRAYIAASPKK